MRILRWPQLQEIVPYSNEHVRYLEHKGHFPRRIKLDPNGAQNGAVGWDADEIDAWIEERKAARDKVLAE